MFYSFPFSGLLFSADTHWATCFWIKVLLNLLAFLRITLNHETRYGWDPGFEQDSSELLKCSLPRWVKMIDLLISKSHPLKLPGINHNSWKIYSISLKIELWQTIPSVETTVNFINFCWLNHSCSAWKDERLREFPKVQQARSGKAESQARQRQGGWVKQETGFWQFWIF